MDVAHGSKVPFFETYKNFGVTQIITTFVANVKTMAKPEEYTSLRLPKATVEELKDVRLAFEANYMKRLTNEELMAKLIACIEDAEPAVWETYCKIVLKRDEEASKKQ